MTDTSSFELGSVLFAASMCQLAVFLLYLFSDGKGNRRLNVGLALVLLFIAIPYLSSFFFVRGPVLILIPVAHMGSVTGFFSGPVLYFYLREYFTGRMPDLKDDGIHVLLFAVILVPFIMMTVVESGNYSISYADIRLPLLFIPYWLLYAILSVSLAIRNGSSPGTGRRSVRWAGFLFCGNTLIQLTSGVIFVIWVVLPQIDRGFWSSRMYFLMKPHSLIVYFAVFIIFINMLIYFCFHGVQMNGHLTKYRHSRLGPGEKTAFTKRIESWMEADKPYLNPLLSLENMSLSLGIPVKDLSQVLNECFSASFSDFVNTYRIREATRMLDEGSSGRTILEISLESGFNAKSTFNMVFRKRLGMSPRDYVRDSGKRKRGVNPAAADAPDQPEVS